MNLPLPFVVASMVLVHPVTALAGEPTPGSTEREGAGEATSEGRLPVAEAERPLTLPALVLNPELDFDITRLGGGTYANLALVGAMGLTGDLTVRATLLPLQLAAPGPAAFRYGQATENVGPSVGTTYRFRKGNVEVGGSLDFGISTVPNSSGLIITPGVPLRLHVGKRMRIDTGAYVPISRLTGTATTRTLPPATLPADVFTTTAGLSVPVSLLYDLTEPLHIGASSAFAVADVSRWSATASIPVSLFTGYAVAGKDGPLLDIDPFLAFPTLLTPGDSQVTHSADYVVGLALGGFLYL